MTDLSKLTAKDFSDAMHKGWESRGWCKDSFREDESGLLVMDNAAATRVCAIGAMACALGVQPDIICDALDRYGIASWTDIADASDKKRTKRAAMKAVDAILLRSKP